MSKRDEWITDREDELEQKLLGYAELDKATVQAMTSDEADQMRADIDEYWDLVWNRYDAQGMRMTAGVARYEKGIVSGAKNKLVMWQSAEHVRQTSARHDAEHLRERYMQELDKFVESFEYLSSAKMPGGIVSVTHHAMSDAEVSRARDDGSLLSMRSREWYTVTRARQEIPKHERYLEAVRHLDKAGAKVAQAVVGTLLGNAESMVEVGQRNVDVINSELRRREQEREEAAQFDALHLADTVRELQERVRELEG